MEELLNNRLIRIVIGTIIGIPLTALSLVTGIHGLILGYAGLTEMDAPLFFVGLITISGFIGISGAWRRILKPTSIMTEKERRVVRGMLICGILSSFALAVWGFYLEQMFEVSLLLAILSIGGVTFIHATPKCSNKI